MAPETGNRPPLREVFKTRLANKIQRFGESIGLTEDAVIDRIASEYPYKSMNEIAAEMGLVSKTVGKLLDYAGVRRLTVEEAIELQKERGIGLFGISPEDRHTNAVAGGQRSAEKGVGVHGYSHEELSEIGKRGGSVSGQLVRDSGLGLFAMTPEQKREAAVKAGKASFERGAGFHSLSTEERSEAGRKGAAIAAELGLGLFGLTTERRREIGREAGRRSAELGAGAHGIDPETGERIAVKAGRRSLELKTGIHARTREQNLESGIQASEVVSSLKVIVGENYFDSRVEAAAALSLERFIPGFVITRGENYQVIIPGVQKKVDFIINGVLVEYNPIILWYTDNGYLGSFDTREEYEVYDGWRKSLSRSERAAYNQQVTESLRQRYYQRRKEAIDQNPDYQERELVVVVNPEQLYDEVITRFGQEYPDSREDFKKLFNATLKRIKNEIGG